MLWGETRPCCSVKQTAEPYGLGKEDGCQKFGDSLPELKLDELTNPLPAQVSDDEGQNAPNSTLSPHTTGPPSEHVSFEVCSSMRRVPVLYSALPLQSPFPIPQGYRLSLSPEHP